MHKIMNKIHDFGAPSAWQQAEGIWSHEINLVLLQRNLLAARTSMEPGFN